MIPKRHTLNRRDINLLFKSGQRASSSPFILLSSPSTIFQISFLIPSTLMKKSSARNLLRRQLYASLGPDLSVYPQIKLAILLKSLPPPNTLTHLLTRLQTTITKLKA